MRDMSEHLERERLAAVARRLAAEGLVSGSGGNVSMRASRGMLITPSGLPLAATRGEDLVLVDLEGRVLERSGTPSSETPMHLAVYRHDPRVGAIVHTHSPYASAFATAGREIPPYHYMVAAVGDRIPLAPYATFGTEALAESAVRTLAGRYGAVLLERHGVLAVGETPEEALNRAVAVEHVAEVTFLALQLGYPEPLPPDEMERLQERFRTYGKSQIPPASQ